MLSSFLNFKGDFFVNEERDDNTEGHDPTSSPCKKEEPIHNLQDVRALGHQANHGDVILPTEEQKEMMERVEKLRARFKESEEARINVLKEAKQSIDMVHKMKEIMECVICRDLIQNPQCLQCGHSACYSCLRAWWTRSPAQNDGAPMVSTDAESDDDEENYRREAVVAAEPLPPRRHRFPSAVNRKKRCPYCIQVIIYRPSPDFHLQAASETLNEPLSPRAQARREARLTRRRDIWHGIFHPENGRNERHRVGRRMLVISRELAPPNLILAQAQELREVELEARQRQRAYIKNLDSGRYFGDESAVRPNGGGATSSYGSADARQRILARESSPSVVIPIPAAVLDLLPHDPATPL